MRLTAKWQNFRFSLRTWLLLLSVLSMLPVLLAMVFGILLKQKEEERQMQATLRARAQGVAQYLEQRIQMAVSSLNALGLSDAAQRGDLKLLYDDAKRVVDGNADIFRAVSLVNREEELLFVTSLPFGAETFTTREILAVRQVFKTGRPNVSGIFVAPASPKALVAVSVPIRQKGNITFCLRMLLTSASISEMLGSVVTSEGWVAVLADPGGNLLARNFNAERFVGRRVAPVALEALHRGERSFFHFETLEGIASTGLWVPVHGGEWRLGLSAPDSVLKEHARQSLQYLLWGGFAGLLFAVALSQWLARYLGRQAQAMADVVGEMSAAQSLHVSEFWGIVQRFLQIRHEEALLGRDLDRVTTQRDEIRDLYDFAPCGYHSLNAEGRLVEINETELHWLGYTHNEVMGRPFSDFFTDKSFAVFREHFPTLKATGELHDLEIELVRKDGSSFPVLVSATAVRDDDGTFVKSRSTVFDISERKAQEEALQQAHVALARERDLLESRVHERTLELARARDDAEGSNRIKTALLSNVSHEFRTPLNHIIGNAYLLDQALTDPQQRAQLHAISQASHDLLVLVNNLIDVSRLEGQQMQLELREFDLRDMLERVARRTQAALAGKAITLACEWAPDLPLRLVGDEARIGQVLQQLLENAVKFSDQGRVVLRARQADRNGMVATVRFEVEDQGIGISEAHRDRVFTLLEQGDGSATRQRGGTGLGLALCHRLVVLMGGRIGVTPVQPHGSCFWFELALTLVPMVPVVAEAQPQAESPPLDVSRLNEVADHMAALLQDDDAEAVSYGAQQHRLLEVLLKEQMPAFEQLLANFEFPQALALLRAQREGGTGQR